MKSDAWIVLMRFSSSRSLKTAIERMEAEADLVNFGRKPELEVEFDSLLVDEEIEKELKGLKSSLTKKDEKTSSS